MKDNVRKFPSKLLNGAAWQGHAFISSIE
jgi:hypothetical protein